MQCFKILRRIFEFQQIICQCQKLVAIDLFYRKKYAGNCNYQNASFKLSNLCIYFIMLAFPLGQAY